MREPYGSAILFFYFLMWPLFVGLPLLYYLYDLNNTPVSDLLWLLWLSLIIQDRRKLIDAKQPF